jgi:hypothetical protein
MDSNEPRAQRFTERLIPQIRPPGSRAGRRVQWQPCRPVRALFDLSGSDPTVCEEAAERRLSEYASLVAIRISDDLGVALSAEPANGFVVEHQFSIFHGARREKLEGRLRLHWTPILRALPVDHRLDDKPVVVR